MNTPSLYPINFQKFADKNPDLTAKLYQRQNQSPIKIYQGQDWKYDSDDHQAFGSVYAAKETADGSGHEILGHIRYGLKNGETHILTHPDLSPAETGLMTFSLLKAANDLSLKRSGNQLTTDGLTTNSAHKVMLKISGLDPETLRRARIQHYKNVKDAGNWYATKRMEKGFEPDELREEMRQYSSSDLIPPNSQFPRNKPTPIVFS